MSSRKIIKTSNGKPMLSARKVAMRLHCAPDYVGKLCREGKLRGRLVDQAWYVDLASIAEFESARKLARATRSQELSQLRRQELAGAAELPAEQLAPAYAPAASEFEPVEPEPQYEASLPPARPRVSTRVARVAGPLSVGAVSFAKVAAACAAAGLIVAGSAALTHLVAPAPSSDFVAALAQVSSPFFGAQPAPTSGFSFGGWLASLFAPKSAAVAQKPLAQAPLQPSTFPLVLGSAPLTSTSTAPAQSAPSKPAVVNNYPVTERVVERVIASQGVSEDELAQKINELTNSLTSKIYSISAQSSGSAIVQYAPSQRIDNLSNVKISGATLTSSSITGYVPSGSALTVTDTSTSTFAGGIALTGGCFSVNGTCISPGAVDASAATGVLAIVHGGTGTTTAPTYGQLLVGNSSGGYDLLATSSLGIVGSGSGFSGGTLTAANVVSTSTATSTFVGGISTAALNVTSTTASSTFANGINLTGGCFSVNGVCVSGGGSSALSGLSDVTLTSPASGNVLQFNGTKWVNVSTSSLGITGGSFSTTSAQYFVDASSTIPKTYTANTFTALQTFSSLAVSGTGTSTFGGGVSATALAISGSNVTLDSFGNCTLKTNSLGQVTCGTDLQGSGSANDWTFFNGSGERLATTSNQLLIGASATTSLAQIEVIANSGNPAAYFKGNVGIGTTSPYAALSVVGQVVAAYFTATTTATSTFAGGINLSGGCFAVNGVCVSGGSSVDLTTSTGVLAISHGGTGTSTAPTYGKLLVGNSSGGYDLLATSSLGIVGSGSGFSGGTLTAANVVSTSTATSTFVGGINLATGAGCLAVNGACISTGSLTNYWSYSGSNLYNNSGTNVGIGNSSPSYALDVTGYANTSLGYKIGGATVLYASSTNFATLVGSGAGASLTSAGVRNTAVGYQALNAATTPGDLTAVGYQALANNVTGSHNTALGSSALNANVSGSQNTAVGSQALIANVTGASNAAFGYNALVGNTTGSRNSAFGAGSLAGAGAASDNTAFGYNALNANTSGTQNVGLGSGALSANTSGSLNVGIAYNALSANTTGSNNVALGSSALGANTTGSYNIALGVSALAASNGDENIAIGHSALAANTNGTENEALGTNALAANTAGFQNIAFGYNALASSVSGTGNSALGFGALRFNTSATSSVALGYQAGYGVSGQSASQNNVFVGYQAGLGNTTGGNNTLLGYKAGSNLTTGSGNIVLGYNLSAPLAAGNNQLTIGNLLFGTNLDGTGTGYSSGRIGVGTSTPFARFAIHANAGDTNTMLFAIGSSTSAGTTTLFSIDNAGLVTLTNVVLTGSTTLQNFTFVNATGTSATTTNLFAATASSTNLFASTATITNLLLGASTTLQNFTFVNATGTSATTTNLFATTASSTNLFASSLAVEGNALYVNNGRVGVGTTTPVTTFAIDGTDAIKIPVGTSVQRPGTTQTGQVRYNVTTHQFEGFGDSGVWQGLGGVIDVSGDTYIIAESSPGADDNTLHFYTGGVQRAIVGPTGNLGLGTTTPYAKFSIGGTDISSTLVGVDALSGFAGKLLDLKVASTTKFSVNQNGDLFVAGSTTLQNLTFINATGTSATTTNLFATTASSTNLFASTATITNLLLGASTTLQNFTFVNATGTSATTTNFFATTASSTNLFASLGTIGTFAVSGNSTLTGTLGVTGQTTLGFASTTQIGSSGAAYLATTGSSVLVGTSTANPWGAKFGIAANGSLIGTVPLLSVESSDLTQVFNVQNNGYIGIGANTASYLLDVRNTTNSSQLHLSGSGADSGGYLTSNAVSGLTLAGGAQFDGTFWVAKAASSSQIDLTNGAVNFYTNTGLTANNAFTRTNRFTITSSGNVGVGTTSPTSLFSVGGDTYLGGNLIATGTATTTNLYVSGAVTGAGLGTCSTSGDKLLWANGTFSCGIDAGAGANENNWVFFNASGVRTGTTTNTVLIGATATTTNGVLEVAGGNIVQTATNPVLASASVGADLAYQTAIAGNYAYIAENANGLRIVDIRNPASPTTVGTYSGVSTALSVAVAGKYAYVGDTTTGLNIIDVSNPSSPVRVGNYSFPGLTFSVAANSLVISGRYVYMTDYNNPALRIIDVSDPIHPRLAGSFAIAGGAPYSLAIAGKYAYVGDQGTGKIIVVDISNPTNPAQVGTYGTGLVPMGLYVSGRYLYEADNTKGLNIINISNPAAPASVGQYKPDASDSYYGLTVAGDYAYVADNGHAKTLVVNISNPSAPVLAGSYTVASGNPMSVALSGKYAYVADYSGGLMAIDITGTKAPAISTGALAADQLNVADNGAFGGDISAGGGIAVGISGIFSRGTIAAFIASTTAQNPTAASFIGGNVGIGTTSPYARLTIAAGPADANVQGILFAISSTTGAYATSTLFSINNAGLVTATNLALTGSTTLQNFVAVNGTTTNATSTNLFATTASSTNLFASTATITNLLLGASTTLQNFTFVNATGTSATTTNLFATNASSTNLFASLGTIGTFAVSGNSTLTGTLNVTGQTTLGFASTTQIGSSGAAYFATGGGNVGVGTTLPGYKLDVAGFINTDQYSGFKQAGNTVLYASTTNNTLAVGSSAAAAWMSASSTAWNSIAIGKGALANTPTNAGSTYNVAIGSDSLSHVTLGGSNVAVGSSALFSNTTGSENFALGANALYNNIDGSYNVGIGASTLVANTSGSYNEAIGRVSMQFNTTGSNNIAIGYATLNVATSSSNNTAIGYFAGAAISGATGAVGGSNTLVGALAGSNITTGGFNTVLGSFTGSSITTGNNNVLIGQDVRSGLSITGSNQLNVGNLLFGTGLSSGATLSGGAVGIGTSSPSATFAVSGNQYTSGTSFFGGAITATSTLNIAGIITSTATAANVLPYASSTALTATNLFASTASITNLLLGASTTLQNFTFVNATGTSATTTNFFASTASSTNLFAALGTIGTLTVSGNTTHTGTLTQTGASAFTGLASLQNASTSLLSVFNKAYFGGTATSTFDSAGNLALVSNGLTVGTNQLVVSGGNVGVGTAAPSSKLDVVGFINTDVTSGYRIGGSLLAFASSTNGTTIFGLGSGGNDATTSASVSGLTVFGYQALQQCAGCSGNTAIGYQSQKTNTPVRSNNTTVGYQTMASSLNSFNNTAIGYQALQFAGNSSNDNVAVGLSALNSASFAAGYNTGVGNYTLSSITGGGNNTALGYNAGHDITTGSNNVYLGSFTSNGVHVTSGSDNIMIGDNVYAGLSRTGSNQLNIGNLLFGTSTASGSTLSTGNIGIGTTSPFARLSVAGDIFATGNVTGTNIIATGTLNVTGQTTLSFASTTQIGSTGAAYFATLGGRVAVASTSANHTLDINGNLGLAAGSYINWGNTDSSSGYGIRDNGGVIQVKNSGNSWVNIPTSGTTQWVTNANGNDISFLSAGSATYAYVGIGTTTPGGAALQIASSTGPQLLLTDPSAAANQKNFFASSSQGSLVLGTLADNLVTQTALIKLDSINRELNPAAALDNAFTFGTTSARINQVNLGGATGTSSINFWQAVGSNYEKGSLGFVTNAVTGNPTLTLGTSQGGSGQNRDVYIKPSGSGSGLYVGASGQVGIGYQSFDTSVGDALLVSGRVGIGTTTPKSKLEVAVNGRNSGELKYGLRIANTDDAASQATGIELVGSGAAGSTWVVGTDLGAANAANFFIGTSTAGSTNGPTYAPFAITSDGAVKLTNTSNVTAGNKLYAQAGGLYWDGTQLNGAGITNYITQSGATNYLATWGNSFGVGTSTAGARLAVAGAAGATTPLFIISTTTAANATSTVFLVDANGATSLTSLFASGAINTSGTTGGFQIDGASVLYASSTTHSVQVGQGAGNTTNASASYNTIVGYNAGNLITTGANNVLLGGYSTGANANLTSGSNNISIGYNISMPSATNNNQLNIQNIIFGTGNSGSGSTVSTGNIGIGTTSPSATFAVQGNGYFSGTSFFGGAITATSTLTVTGLTTLGNASTTQIGSTGNAYFATSGGSVGIGQTAPGSALDVKGNVKIENGATNLNYLAFGDSNTAVGGGTSVGVWRADSTGASAGNSLNLAGFDGIYFRTNAGGGSLGTPSTTAMMISQDGNVGIGNSTGAPAYKLTVGTTDQGANDDLAQFYTPANASGMSFSTIRLEKGAGYGGVVRGFLNQGVSSGLALGTINAGAVANSMYLTNNGNVGIGTSSPETTLHVSSPNFADGLALANVDINTYTTAAADVGGSLNLGGQYNTGSQDTLGFGRIAGRKENGTSGDWSGYLQLSTRRFGGGFVERMRVTSNGNVGIGTTTPQAPLQIGGANGTGFATNGGKILLASGGALNGPESLNGIEFESYMVNAGYATKLYTSNTGDLWGIATRYNSATWTERLVVKEQTGNIGIGTTTPSGRLHVEGTSSSNSILYINDTRNDSASGASEVSFQRNMTTVGSVTTDPAATHFNTTSDRRLKENIATTTMGIDTLKQIPVRNFDFINDPTHAPTQGFIAQELYQYYPYAVATNGDNGVTPLGASSTPWQVDYGRLTPLLAQSIKDVNAKVDSILNGTATSTITNVAYQNASTTNTDTLCLGGDCRTAWPAQATTTVDLSAYATNANVAASLASATTTLWAQVNTNTANIATLSAATSTYAKLTDLSSFVSTSTLLDYARLSDIPDTSSFVSTSTLAAALSGISSTTTNITYSTTTADLSGYATISDLNTNYQSLTTSLSAATSSIYSALGNYVSTSSLANALASYATVGNLALLNSQFSIFNSQLATATSSLASLVARFDALNTTTTLLQGGTLAGNIIPAAHDTYDLGSNTVRFANVYAKNINAGDLTFTETANPAGYPAHTFVAGDVVSLFVTTTAGSTHTVPVDLQTALSTGISGANPMYFNTSGGLGIGVASSTGALNAELDVRKASTGDTRLLSLNNASATGNLSYQAYIGTSGDLTLASNDNSQGSRITNSRPVWGLTLGGISDYFDVGHAASGSGAFSSVSALRITNAGNVGIGTTTPAATFAVNGSGFFGGNLTVNSFTATSTTAVNSFGQLLATGSTTLQNLTFLNATGTAATTTNLFATTASSTNLFASVLAIAGNTLVTSGGNVGVGNTAPSTLLEVGAAPTSGSTIMQAARFNASSDNFNVVGIERGGVVNPQGLYFGINHASLYSEIQASHSGVGTDALVLNRQGGNVGIGTTSPATTLSVGGNGYVTGGLGVGVVNTSAGSIQATGNVLLNNNTWYQMKDTSGTAQNILSIDGFNGLNINSSGGSSVAPIVFKENASEIARFDTSGRLGIGTSTPAAKLQIGGGGSIGLDIGQNDGIFQTALTTHLAGNAGSIGLGINDGGGNAGVFVNNALSYPGFTAGFSSQYITFKTAAGGSFASTERMRIDPAGNVGIGTTTPATALQVFGDIRTGTTGTNGCVQNWAGTALTGTCSSDSRLKTVDNNVTNVLDKVANLQLVNFHWNQTAANVYHNDTSVTNTGFIAQAVQAQFPELVTTDKNGYEQLDYTTLGLYNIEATKELNAKVNSILNGTATSTITNVAYQNASTTVTDNLCVGGTCITSFAQFATTTPAVDLSGYVTNTALVSALSSATSTLSQNLAALVASSTPDLTALATRVSGVESSEASTTAALAAEGALLEGHLLQLNTFASSTNSALALLASQVASIPTTTPIVNQYFATTTNITNTYSTTTTADLSNYFTVAQINTATSTLFSQILALMPTPVSLGNLHGTVTGDIIPNNDNAYTLGTPTNRFTNIYAKNINAGDLTFTETANPAGYPAHTFVAGDVVSLFVTTTAGSTHTVPVDLQTALSTGISGANPMYFNTSGGLGIGVASSTGALQAELDVRKASTGDTRLLSLNNASATGNLSYQAYINNTSGDLTIASNDGSQGTRITNSRPVWGLTLGGISDYFDVGHAASGSGAFSSVSALRITNAGNVGIGTTTPYAMLSVAGNVVGTNLTATGTLSVAGNTTLANASTTQIGSTGSAYFATGGGSVGIGTTTPSSLFSVAGSGYFTGNLGIGTSDATYNVNIQALAAKLNLQSTTGTNNVYLQTKNTGGNFLIGSESSVGGSLVVGSSAYANIINAQSANPIQFGTTNTVRMTIDSSGNVGIGTTPSYKFHVSGDASATSNILEYLNNSGGASTRLAFQDTATTFSTNIGSVGNNFTVSTVGSERLRVDGSGNVGIGTTTPNAPLSVQANSVGLMATSFVTNSINPNYMNIFNGANNVARIGMEASGGASVFTGGSANAAVFGNGSANPVQFATNNTVRMTIDSSGFVGIGTVGSGWKFTVAGDAGASWTNSAIAMTNTGTGARTYALGPRSDGTFNISDETASAVRFSIASNGNATFTGTGGTCTINGSGACTSDQRLKTNIAAISGTDALAGLAKISGVTYNWIDQSLDQAQRVGVIAQAVQSAFPQLVGHATTTLNGVSGSYLTVDYGGLTAPLISATNELNVRTSAFASSTASGVVISAPIISLSQAATTTIVASEGAWSIATSTATGTAPIISVSAGTTTTVAINAMHVYINGVDMAAAVGEQLLGTTTSSYTPADSSYAGKFIAALKGVLSAWLADAGNGIADLFAAHIHAQIIDAQTVNTQTLCVGSTCITEVDLKNILSGQAASSTSATSTDTQAPVITLSGANPASIAVGAGYIDAGATVTDNVNLNLGYYVSVDGGPATTPANMSLDTSVDGTHHIVFSATDQAGNEGYATRTVIVGNGGTTATTSATTSGSSAPTATTTPDTTAPVITLVGASSVTLTEGSAYTDAGATAADNVDGNITAKIVTVNPVNTAAAGTYSVTYNVSDAAGNAAAQVTRTVTVATSTATSTTP